MHWIHIQNNNWLLLIHSFSFWVTLITLVCFWMLRWISDKEVSISSFFFLSCGESGARRTKTIKIVMQYLVVLGGGGRVEYEILKSNPNLEVCSNAKTFRNDNSSRFVSRLNSSFFCYLFVCTRKSILLFVSKLWLLSCSSITTSSCS